MDFVICCKCGLIVLCCATLLETVSYHVYSEHEHLEWAKYGYRYGEIVNSCATCLILGVSLCNQWSEISFLSQPKPYFYQQSLSSIILLCCACCYFLAFTFISKDHKELNILNFILCGVIGIHLISHIQWAKVRIDEHKSFEKFSLNWFCAVFLIMRCFSWIEFLATQPWQRKGAYRHFEVTQRKLFGDFGYVFISLILRPTLCVVIFRVIEQISHQLQHSQHPQHGQDTQNRQNMQHTEQRSANANDTNLRLMIE